EKIVTRQGLFDMPTFRISIKNNEKLNRNICLCINIYLKLMDVWRYPYANQANILKCPKNENFIFS
ncbi:hypothetical protein OCB15_28690, partial [Bacillus cereus]|nr:hypothetical protein [Bacillus cereus]